MFRSEQPRLLVASATFAALATALSASACRKRTPDEVVFTKKTAAAPTVTAAPPSPPVTLLEPPKPMQPFSKRALLGAVADCALTRVRSFEDKARVLRAAARAFATSRTPANDDATQRAWRDANEDWQVLELFRFGPAARAGDPGAKDLRDQINAWPLFSRCKVDEQIVARTYADGSFGTSLVNGRGLASIEYLTFHRTAANGCIELAPINTQGSWAALSSDELAQRRADYAAAASELVGARAEDLASAWDPARGNFHRELASAGLATYASEQAALNAVSHALFFVDKELKDEKLGRPTGVFECQSETCPQALESPWARASLSNVRANLRGFRDLFQGCGEGGAGFGFDDWLDAVGASDLKTHMLTALATAENTAASLEPSLEDVIAQTPLRARTLHADVKVLTDALKTELVTVLNLELPKVAEGDND